MSPELSVIIPTYKRTNSLQKLLDLLLSQQMINIEIIVVDQNTDGHFDDDLVATLSRVKWLKQAKPNASAARNQGFLSSTAPYLLFIDDDLIPGEDFCRKGVDIFLNFPGINSFAPLVYIDAGKDAALASARKSYLATWPGNDQVFSISDTMSAAVFFKRAYFLQTGGFDEYLFEFAKTAEDLEFFRRMMKKGLKLWYVALVSVYHDEKTPGGCDLRTADYWITREKCMKAWALGFRTAAGGKLSIADYLSLLRSCVLNTEVIKSGPQYIARQFSLMRTAIHESGLFFENRKSEYTGKIEKGFLQ